MPNVKSLLNLCCYLLQLESAIILQDLCSILFWQYEAIYICSQVNLYRLKITCAKHNLSLICDKWITLPPSIKLDR